MKIIIDPHGNIRCIHADSLVPILRAIGPLTIARASDVEPTLNGQWTANMGRVNGPVLGPFDTRTEALAKETEWLTNHQIPLPTPLESVQTNKP